MLKLGMLGEATPAPPAGRPSFRFAFWISVLTTVLTLISLAVSVTTLPISGPFCAANCVTYPYANVSAYVPHDYMWMIPTLLLAFVFLVLMVCIHNSAGPGRELYSQIGLCFAAIATGVLSIDYYIQLAMVQPSLLQGETEGLALISQYNPHGIFIALEELGYLMMSLAFLFMGLVFVGESKLDRSLHWLFILSGLLGLGTYAAMSMIYGKALEYRFEVTILSITWLTLMPAGVLLSFWFRRLRLQSAAS